MASAARRVLTRLTYPQRPPAGFQNGRIVTPSHWKKIGSIFPTERWLGDVEKLHDEEDTRNLHVSDARVGNSAPTLARNGFELRKSPSTVVDFFDDDVIMSKYYEETSELVKAATGARDVFVFQHMRRDSNALNKDTTRNENSTPSHGAVQRVHADYTPENGPMKLQELEATGVVPEGHAANRRWSIVNVWRSIAEQPVQTLPLAVLDAATVVADDCFSYALVYAEASPPLVGFNNGVAYSEDHAWYYYSQMAKDEALLLYTYDGSTAPPRFVFHTAFATDDDVADVAQGPPARASIECRCLVLF